MRISYDKEANAAYIYIADEGPIKACTTYCCDPVEINGMINLDFDSNGKLLGIEIMDADKKLPEVILKNF